MATGWIADGAVTRLEKDRRDDATTRQHIARKALTGSDYPTHPPHTLRLALAPLDHLTRILHEVHTTITSLPW